MKKVLLFLAAFLLCQTTFGQENWLWPVKGLAAGQGIIYAPDSYIGKEHNFGALFLTAAEGTEIVSPTDGTITHAGAFYYYDLNRCLGNGIDDENDTFDQLIKSMIEHDDSCIPKYVTGSISISSSDGCMINIQGLTGNQHFKTGQKIKKGDQPMIRILSS